MLQLSLTVVATESRWRMIQLLTRLLAALDEGATPPRHATPRHYATHPSHAAHTRHATPLRYTPSALPHPLSIAPPPQHCPSASPGGQPIASHLDALQQWLPTAWTACHGEQLLMEAVVDAAAAMLAAARPAPL